MNWPPLLPDPQTSWAVLVGAGSFHDPGLPDLPEAVASVDELADTLTGPTGLLRWDHVVRIHDPQSPADVLRPLAAVAAEATGLLLCYYAGHGVLDGARRLHLALPGTSSDPARVPHTALAAQAVLELVGGSAARALHRVAWLDCCFGGLALDLPAAADVNLLTAADRTRKALVPPGSRITGFAAELTALLRDGVPDGPPYLDLPLIHRRLAVALGAVPAGLPARTQPPNPCHRLVHTGPELALARNAAHGTALTRDGLLARARFAYRVADVRAPHRPAQAAALLGDIVRDATAALGGTDPDTLRLRHAHAWLTGEAHGPDAARALLLPLLADLASDDPQAERVRQSLASLSGAGAPA
ncbi:hypothetical protein P3T36_001726 [Kitasatospora sp. MAP12-15]|uniref:caspase, EACC1-associated type n=1 Tax=unclassified Kitasatospora TaxID=2633591 RepID=UPI002475C2EC|nr:hypothetical protein [Kitasatospora sp. MAP12-44]MDH6113395.1 hypothetical protein [Kitasatospora sp. MAP12-44]